MSLNIANQFNQKYNNVKIQCDGRTMSTVKKLIFMLCFVLDAYCLCHFNFITFFFKESWIWHFMTIWCNRVITVITCLHNNKWVDQYFNNRFVTLGSQRVHQQQRHWTFANCNIPFIGHIHLFESVASMNSLSCVI